MSATDAIREALAKLGVEAQTTDVKEYIKQHHKNIDVTAPGFPSALSGIKRELRERTTGGGGNPPTNPAKPKPKKKNKAKAITAVASQQPGTPDQVPHFATRVQQLVGIVGRDRAKKVLLDMVDGKY
ncbi:MAG TPA: hypothetical protein VKE40_24085 [Gemmataceae bacterium]|nr:hypothetical protein [Gemmataceae bacterium]